MIPHLPGLVQGKARASRLSERAAKAQLLCNQFRQATIAAGVGMDSVGFEFGLRENFRHGGSQIITPSQ